VEEGITSCISTLFKHCARFVRINCVRECWPRKGTHEFTKSAIVYLETQIWIAFRANKPRDLICTIKNGAGKEERRPNDSRVLEIGSSELNEPVIVGEYGKSA